VTFNLHPFLSIQENVDFSDNSVFSCKRRFYIIERMAAELNSAGLFAFLSANTVATFRLHWTSVFVPVIAHHSAL